jgi:hypothetical protein
MGFLLPEPTAAMSEKSCGVKTKFLNKKHPEIKERCDSPSEDRRSKREREGLC